MLEVGAVSATTYKAAMILFAALHDYFGPGTHPSRDILQGCAYDLVQYKKILEIVAKLLAIGVFLGGGLHLWLEVSTLEQKEQKMHTG